MNTKSSSRSFPKGLDMTGKDERIGKKELEVNNHVKYSAFAIVLANALYLVAFQTLIRIVQKFKTVRSSPQTKAIARTRYTSVSKSGQKSKSVDNGT